MAKYHADGSVALDKEEADLFITEFPREGFGIVEQLQGRMQFAILDQIKFMKSMGMAPDTIKKTIMGSVLEIIETNEARKAA